MSRRKSTKSRVSMMRGAAATNTATAVAPFNNPAVLHPKMNNNILSLIESGVTGLTLTLTLEDLQVFATDIVEKAKAQLLPIMVKASHEDLLSKKEVMALFDVCNGTLWNWEQKNYLIPVKINRKIFYRQADVDRVIMERGKR